MKDWKTAEPDVVKLLTKHFTKGRSGKSVKYIVVHYNAGDLTVEGCYSVWQTREASAHYQVESSGRIGQLVWDRDTAWHAGDWNANCQSIGIEHANKKDGTITEECLDNGAHLVAALCRLYKLGRPQWLKNVYPHKYFSATSCPGQIYGSQKDAYIERAQYWYDKMDGKDVSKPSASKPATGKLTVDGLWGEDTTRAAQKQAGTPVDGIVSSQEKEWKSKFKGCTTGWEWVSKPKGSQLIEKIQITLRDKYKQNVGEIDGIAGKKFWQAMELAAGYDADNKGFEYPSNTVKWFQKKLNAGTFF